jgi:hypothetical protein
MEGGLAVADAIAALGELLALTCSGREKCDRRAHITGPCCGGCAGVAGRRCGVTVTRR